MQLRVAQIVEDTEAEGPGRRFAIWVQGCPLRCAGCCNPGMLRFEGGEDMDVAALAARVLATPGIEGVSLLGGEPFAQSEACAELARRVRPALSVMVYSGFTLAELAGSPLLGAIDLLVDGRYVREEPEAARRWIGSRNQQLHFLSPRYDADDPRFRTANTVELRLSKGELVVNGWPALAAGVLRR